MKANDALANIVNRFEDRFRGDSGLDRLSARLSVVLLLLLAALFFYVALSRMAYPFEIETQEGETFLAALRVVEGKTLYPSPENEPFWVPTILAPLYYYLSGIGLRIIGAKIWIPRLISFLATLLISAMIMLIARRSGVGKTHSLAAGLLFLAFYPVSGQWYDVARVDMTFYALSLGAFVLLDKDELSIGRLATAVILFVLAMFTKQVGVFYVAAACLYLLRNSFKQSFLFGASCAAATAIIGLIYNTETGGEFLFFTMKVGSAHVIYPWRLLNPWPWLKFAIPLVVALTIAAATGKKPFRKNRQWHLWLLYFAACLPAGMLPWAKFGGYLNDFIPMFLALCILIGLCDRPMIRLAIIGQAALLFYNPAIFIPPEQVTKAGEKFIERLAASDGQSYVEDHPYYSWLARKPVYPKALYVAETEMAGRPASKELTSMIQNQAFDKIFSDGRRSMSAFDRLIQSRYKKSETITITKDKLKGIRMFPRYVLEPVRTIATWNFDAGLPSGWTIEHGFWISPKLPPQCDSVSFNIDGNGNPPTTIRLYVGHEIIAQTAGIPEEQLTHIRWDASACANKACHVVISEPGLLSDGSPALSNLAFER